MRRMISLLLALLLALSLVSCASPDSGDVKEPAASDEGEEVIMEFMDCFETTPLVGELTDDCWGAEVVGKRDQDNGLEDKILDDTDADGTRYCYWDGAIIKEGGKYYMLAAR